MRDSSPHKRFIDMNEWTPERVERLKELWAAGLTGGQVAKEMNITRNAAIGKVSRLRLAARKDPFKTRISRPRIHDVGDPGLKYLRRVKRLKPAKTPPPMPPDPLNVPLIDLVSRHCRYIVGKDETGQALYCGHDKEINFYCSYHADKCYNREALTKVQYRSSFGHRLPSASFPEPPLALRKGTCL